MREPLFSGPCLRGQTRGIVAHVCVSEPKRVPKRQFFQTQKTCHLKPTRFDTPLGAAEERHLNGYQNKRVPTCLVLNIRRICQLDTHHVLIPLWVLLTHVCGDPLSRYTCHATRIEPDFLALLGVAIFKVPEGHHPRGTTLCEALRGNLPLRGLCGGLSEGSAGSLRGFCGVSAGFCGGPRDFPRVFGGSDPMLVTLALLGVAMVWRYTPLKGPIAPVTPQLPEIAHGAASHKAPRYRGV